MVGMDRMDWSHGHLYIISILAVPVLVLVYDYMR